jgi:hypothetical protein
LLLFLPLSVALCGSSQLARAEAQVRDLREREREHQRAAEEQEQKQTQERKQKQEEQAAQSRAGGSAPQHGQRTCLRSRSREQQQQQPAADGDGGPEREDDAATTLCELQDTWSHVSFAPAPGRRAREAHEAGPEGNGASAPVRVTTQARHHRACMLTCIRMHLRKGLLCFACLLSAVPLRRGAGAA